ncbi:unnamed protein product [Sphagnum balticum]
MNEAREKTVRQYLTDTSNITRQRLFAAGFKTAISTLNENPTVKHKSEKASGNSYCAGVDRKRVRTLARKMARESMRSIRIGD